MMELGKPRILKTYFMRSATSWTGTRLNQRRAEPNCSKGGPLYQICLCPIRINAGKNNCHGDTIWKVCLRSLSKAVISLSHDLSLLSTIPKKRSVECCQGTEQHKGLCLKVSA